mgnify:CR=1 FL=1
MFARKQGAAAYKGTVSRPLASSPLPGNDPPTHPHIWPCLIFLYGKFNVHGGGQKIGQTSRTRYVH